MTPNEPEAGRSTLPIHSDPARRDLARLENTQPENAKPNNAQSENSKSNNAQLAQVSKLFGSFAALRQVSLAFEPGRCYVLLGENGAGKSTLLRILAGLLRPTHGTVSVFGESRPQDARARIGYMSHAPMLYDELTAQENLRYFSRLYPGRPCLTPADALRQVGLDPELNRLIGQYSQGMRQRTSLARVLLSVPELLLLDEPFSNMDVESARQMVALLAGFRQSNRTIVLTTHQRELAAPIADFVITLHAGRIASINEGSPRTDPGPQGGTPGFAAASPERHAADKGSPTQ